MLGKVSKYGCKMKVEKSEGAFHRLWKNNKNREWIMNPQQT
jgi:hypothetical protein